MYPFFMSTLAVAGAEMGDKTQLLALLLAARFKKPLPIILGILVASLLNHSFAGFIGVWIGHALQGALLHGVLALSFLAAAIWVLIPDKLEDTQTPVTTHTNIFITTAIAFFLAEIGDKTQLVTAVLAAKYQALVQVILGTTLGMLLANVPAVLLGHKMAHYLPLKPIRYLSALVFAGLAGMQFFKLL